MNKFIKLYLFATLIIFTHSTYSIVVSSSSALDEDTPQWVATLYGSQVKTGSRPWRKPQFEVQNNPLGYNEKTFEIPKGMEKQVQFWIDIYSKYTTSQGVIHDSKNVDLVYGVIDFTDIENDPQISKFLKERHKQKKVDAFKKTVIDTLMKLSTLSTPENLTSEEMRLWLYFGGKKSSEYVEAANSSRVRFQLGQKDRMQSAIYFSGRYLEDMESIFEKEGLPIELTRLVFVESSFNVLARSKVGASGLWQIMPYTAKPYKMISPVVDKRNHPLDSTRVSAKLLKMNFKMLESWPLAITGYNHGPAGVRKMTQKYNTRSIYELVRNVQSSVTFGFASRNFYSCFLAALEVERNASRYFNKVMWSKKLDAESFKLPNAIAYHDLKRWFGDDEKRLQVFNPHLTSLVRKGQAIPENTLISIPKEQYTEVLLALTKKRKPEKITRREKKSQARGRQRVADADKQRKVVKSF